MASDSHISQIVDEALIFRSLENGIRAKLKAEAHACHFAAGDVILREGDPGSEMMIVTSGKVSVSQRTANGEVTLAQLGEKAVIGEVSVITGIPRTGTVVALDDVSVVCFSAETIHSIIESSPKVKSLFLKLIEGRALRSIEAGKQMSF
jgi:CRP/FNR family transcriptional regulator, cyclic AMP receptor protein